MSQDTTLANIVSETPSDVVLEGLLFDTVILHADATWDDTADNPYWFPAGAVLAKATSGALNGYYGAHEDTVVDGRALFTTLKVLVEDVDLATYDGSARSNKLVKVIMQGTVRGSKLLSKDNGTGAPVALPATPLADLKKGGDAADVQLVVQ